MLPNFIIIGAQKSGTTSLYYYLRHHPQIWMSRPKELDFFIEEFNWRRGVKWYESKFRIPAPVRGESSPNYAIHPLFSGVPERMHSVVPDAKLIYVVRNPIERTLSQYVHMYAEGAENRPIAEVLRDLKDNVFLMPSRYYTQLELFLRHYPMSRILILSAEELRREPLETLRKIFRFLGVDETALRLQFFKLHHESKAKRRKNRMGLLLAGVPGMQLTRKLRDPYQYLLERFIYYPFSHPVERPTLSKEQRALIWGALEDDICRFRALTGRDFPEWQLEEYLECGVPRVAE